MKYTLSWIFTITLCVLMLTHTALALPAIKLHVTDVPEDGLVVAPLSLDSIKTEISIVNPLSLTPVVTVQGKAVPAQWIPDPDFSAIHPHGTMLMKSPVDSSFEASVQFLEHSPPGQEMPATAKINTGLVTYSFDVSRSGFFPDSIRINASKLVLDGFHWNDRLYDKKTGEYFLRMDKNSSIKVLSKGPIATILRGTAKYVNSNGEAAAGAAHATYDWYYFHHSNLVYVQAWQDSDATKVWHQSHFGEINFSTDFFDRYAGDAFYEPGKLTGSKQAFKTNQWACLLSKDVAIGILNTKTRIYDGYQDYGTYVHVNSPNGWSKWDGKKRHMAAWWWIGQRDTPAQAVAQASDVRRVQPRIVAIPVSTAKTLEEMRLAAERYAPDKRKMQLWKVALLQQLIVRGELPSTVIDVAELPTTWKYFRAGNLGLAIDLQPDGVRLISLFDLQRQVELLSPQKAPLFSVDLVTSTTGSAETVQADAGWKKCSVKKDENGFTIHFSADKIPISATVTASADAVASAWHWRIQVKNSSPKWSIKSVAFPQINLADLGNGTKVLYPQGQGVQNENPYATEWSYDGKYPSGWCTMQFVAAYNDRDSSSGLYLAQEDPFASTKRIGITNSTEKRNIHFSFTQTAKNYNQPGNDFALSGESVWQLLHGDWFDASEIYKKWVIKEAPWWPKITAEGRQDTPVWFKQLDFWGRLYYDAETVVPQAIALKNYLNVPEMGLHWYRWRQSPYDNDYPHFFPARKGFRDGVSTLQQQGVNVMPYINARIWDTRDRGSQDWQYSSKALPYTTKTYTDGTLQPHTEIYGSREKNNAGKVVFATMCPYTKFWQDTMIDLARRMTLDEGVRGIYLDQIAAAATVQCMDPSHGHPLGGGHWWVDGYNTMLKRMQDAIPDDVILTSECNAEPYIKYMDGYLAWHWQFDNAVPAFPAVYNEAIVTFGCDYAGKYANPDEANLAFRMKSAQQFIYGEQLGWLNSDYFFKRLNEDSRSYFKNLVRLRHQKQKYFYAGEMERPPNLTGNLPTVTADWKWLGHPRPVTTSSIMTASWKLEQEEKLILIFTNVSDRTVSASFNFDPKTYGIKEGIHHLKLRVNEKQMSQISLAKSPKEYSLSVLPLSTQTWEFSW